jgi:hypothetical protein
MKSIIYSMIFCFMLVVSTGCERMETAVDTYTKVKEDAKQKARQAQDEANKIVDKKLQKTDDSSSQENEKDKD